MKVRYLPVADLEATEAAEYYERQRPGLGYAFIDELKATETRIAQHPNAWPANSSVTRSCLVKRFPYSMIYRVSSEEIVIVAIHHHKRDPRRWEDRITQ
jgi:plasmid stabilization system protein ParE